MIRKLLLPVLAATLLAGCVTDYTYRGNGGRGDYYYGRPSVDYRYYGGYYGGYYPSYGYPYRYGGGYPYRYGYGYPYRNPYPYYHGGHPRPPVVRPPRPGTGTPPPYRPDSGKAPWRDLDGLRRQGEGGGRMQPRQAGPAPSRPAPRPSSAPRREGGSPVQQMMRRSTGAAGQREVER
ncbi:hypothetical protein ACFOLC_07060 [Lysobacter cavernae]|uniref:Lipoprotein n=1 Tax=Lysobacter cavernae TaxID=1685901 RepID=A0ABV7RQ79_9GAMM